MAETLFTVGREPELSVAELEAVSGTWKASVTHASKEYAVLEHAEPLPARTIDRLGGCTKQAEVTNRWTIARSPTDTVRDFFTAEWILEHVPPDLRIEFGVSAYGFSRSEVAAIQKHAMWLKKELKATGRPARLVTSKEPQLSAVTVQRQGLLKNGREFIIARADNAIHVGVTIAVQDYQAYSLRDFGRPAADPKSGMLPPKLAQIMLNIAQVRSDDILLDPFCGSGTVLQEAILLGGQEVRGCDTETKAVKAAQENIRWLLKEFPNVKTNVEITAGDARRVNVRPTVIVTEPFLGKPLYGNEPQAFLEKQAKELSELYLQSFRHWKTILKPGGRVVMVWPEFIHGDNVLGINLESQLAALGFVQKPLLSPGLAITLKAENPAVLLYAREDARVGRQIRRWDFTLNK